jgi:hypothetical protein
MKTDELLIAVLVILAFSGGIQWLSIWSLCSRIEALECLVHRRSQQNLKPAAEVE